MRSRLFAVVLSAASLVATTLPSGAGAADPTKQPVATGTGGAIATVELEASRAGLDILRRGGNAVDAAVAAAAVLGVTEPYSCGIGGGGFMVVYTAADGEVVTIDHREESPASMRPGSFFEDGAPLPFNAARYSGLSAGVPGTVRGWSDALARYGTMSLRTVLQPAIGVARNGFVVDQVFHDQTQANVAFFDDLPATEAVFLDPDGTPPDVGSTFRNPDLAAAMARIARLGPNGFYRGAIADAMVEAVQDPPVAADADHVWRPGLMTMRDLMRYKAVERAPTAVDYRGYEVYGMGPPSSGGSTIGEALNILEAYDLGAMEREQALHLFIEASRFSFADRNAYLADPDHFDVPLQGLLSDGFAAERRALIGEVAATSPVAPGNPYPYDGGSGTARAGSATVTRAGSTTHLTVTDRWGNVVSYTFTIESTGGNGMVVPGWGFLLNNELTDFNYDSLTHPNRADGDKRPRSSMSPTIVLRDGAPVVALGTPGGSTIITAVLQLLVEHLDLGKSLPEAIAAARLTQRNTSSTLAEPAFFGSPEEAALRARGHRFGMISEIGAATGITFLPRGLVQAAAEPSRRGGGSALVEEPTGP